MSSPSAFNVRFVEWLAMEIVVDEALNAKDALIQARSLWEESGDNAKLRDNGTECWEAERIHRSDATFVCNPNSRRDTLCQ